VKRAALALAALASATLALAQQTTPQTPAEPSTSTTPREQAAPPTDSGPRRLSEADKQTLMGDCLRQVQANNPNVSGKDIKVYCDKAVKDYASPR
jgi:hypothetical protein